MSFTDLFKVRSSPFDARRRDISTSTRTNSTSSKQPTPSSSTSSSSSLPSLPTVLPQLANKPRRLFPLVVVAVVALQIVLVFGVTQIYRAMNSGHYASHKYSVDVAANNYKDRSPFANQRGTTVIVGSEKDEADVQDTFHHVSGSGSGSTSSADKRGGGLRQKDAKTRRLLAYEAAMKSVYHHAIPRDENNKNDDGSRKLLVKMNFAKRRDHYQNERKIKQMTDDTWSQHLRHNDMFLDMQQELEAEHAAFLERESQFIKKLRYEQATSTDGDDVEKNNVHLAMIAADFYTALDAYFVCAFGADELRPFQCTAFNWPSAVELVAETVPLNADEHHESANADNRRRQQKRQQKQPQDVGALLTLVDALSTLLIVDGAVLHLATSASRSSAILVEELGLKRRFFSAAKSSRSSRDPFSASPHFHFAHAQTEQEKSQAAALAYFGFSNVTLLTIHALNSQLHERLSASARFLSTFEINIRMVGGLVSAHDLLLRTLQFRHRAASSFSTSTSMELEQHRRHAAAIKDIARCLMQQALRIGNKMLGAFVVASSSISPSSSSTWSDNSHPPQPITRPHFAHSVPAAAAGVGAATNAAATGSSGRSSSSAHHLQFGFPLPFFRYRDGRSVNTRGDKTLYLSEIGTFDLEFAALSGRTGCNIFDVLRSEMMEWEMKRARPPRALERKWKQTSWRKRLQRQSVVDQKTLSMLSAAEEAQVDGGAGSRAGATRPRRAFVPSSFSASSSSSSAQSSDSGFRFSTFFSGSERIFSAASNNGGGDASASRDSRLLLSNAVEMQWRDEQVSMGPLSDSYFEYRLKFLIASRAAASSNEHDDTGMNNGSNKIDHGLNDACMAQVEAAEIAAGEKKDLPIAAARRAKQQKIMNSNSKIGALTSAAAAAATTFADADEEKEAAVRNLMDSIDDLLVDCFVPSNEYAADWLATAVELVDPVWNAALQKERCVLSTLKGSVQQHRMTHLSCFTGGSFALAAAALRRKYAANIKNNNSSDSSIAAAAAAAIAERYLRLARGLALSCSDMSRLTREGIAGEDYESIYELRDTSNSNNNNSNQSTAAPPAAVDSDAVLKQQQQQQQKQIVSEPEMMELSGMRLKTDRRGWINQQHVLRPEALEAMWYAAVVSDDWEAAAAALPETSKTKKVTLKEKKKKKNNSHSAHATIDSNALAEGTATGSDMRREAWRIYSGMRRRCRSPRTGGFSGLKLTRPKTANMLVPQNENGEKPLLGDDHGTKLWERGVQFRDVYDDVQMSFFFAETLKYSMMLFADCARWRESNNNSRNNNINTPPPHDALFLEIACGAPLGGGEWVLNTEAHPLRFTRPPSAFKSYDRIGFL